MHDENCSNGCAEYRELSRRGFMGVAGAATLTALATPAWLPRVAMAKDHRSSQRDVVIPISLRGACDGLPLCTPWPEANSYPARPNIAVPRPDSGLPNRGTDLGVSVNGPN